MPDSIMEFARIKSRIREATDKIMEEEGITWNGLTELENQASVLMSSDVIETDYGTLQKIYKKPVQYRMRRLENPDEPIFPERLKFTPLQQKES
jgi:hypothetical protein